MNDQIRDQALAKCNKWLERYGARIRVYRSALWVGRYHAPMTSAGALQLCAHVAKRNQDIYRPLPEL
jgi:hypothetical protein